MIIPDEVRKVLEEVDYSDTLISQLFERGYCLIGRGFHAEVFDLGDTVMKVMGFGVDKAYEAFVRVCLANPDDPHLPTIHYEGRVGTWRVFVLEKLSPLPHADKPALRRAYWKPIEYHLAEKTTHMKGWVEKVDVNLPASLDLTLDLIVPLLTVHGMDLHGANVMLRDETLVITDPVC